MKFPFQNQHMLLHKNLTRAISTDIDTKSLKYIRKAQLHIIPFLVFIFSCFYNLQRNPRQTTPSQLPILQIIRIKLFIDDTHSHKGTNEKCNLRQRSNLIYPLFEQNTHSLNSKQFDGSLIIGAELAKEILCFEVRSTGNH